VSARWPVAAAAGRAVLWLLPAGRRDWVEALWAESAALPPTRERARWRAGAVWLVAREALRSRPTSGRVAFTLAAALAAVGCWPGSAANVVTATVWVNVIAVVATLGGMGWLARQAFGPVRARWLPRAVRAVVYGAILAMLPAEAVAGRYDYDVVDTHPFLRRYVAAGVKYQGPPFLLIEGFLLFVLVGCVLAVLWLTSARSQVTGRALALAVGFGLILGACGYLSAPLGPRDTTGIDAVNPWLPRSWLGGVTIADWVLLFAGPALLGPVAGFCFRGREGRDSLADRRFVQCLCVGLLGNVVAVLTATVAASVTIAVALEFPAAANYLDHGANLRGTAAYLWGLNAGGSEGAFLIAWFCVPMVGLVVSGVIGALPYGRELLAGGGDSTPPGGGGGGHGRGGPPRDPAPSAPVAPQDGRTPEVPDRQPVLTG
jgi:hypothetical protein